ncbi:GNAT family N-acetyltransferase [Clostridium sp. E02]|uniref:GNAT family N-acetyltransferase n=1 Tax=Clostridium sp. E02 TaxID=2487134 RepID=UPI000F53886D|nr:GNAT family N-acetyltransferase [Clostridium sp. E02]
MRLFFRQCTQEDICTLREFSYKTYNETFEETNTPSNMKAYLDKSFDIERLRVELLNGNSMFYFLYSDGELSGYLKLNEAPAQTDINDGRSLEIERIYIAKEFQGKGLGTELMDRAIDLANMRKKLYVWLGVWEENEKAVLFYKKNGFYQIGSHSFFMGDDEQTDYIMRKNL